ncbi:MAG: chloride channel protein [Bacteroidota bacterium]|nr:chloride channel protein [Bacteroidota bacterium]MDP4190115.1 chloride channel protein [Bacteroidota bacterium]MDP4193730.1 chloride channel protein [Bacteroidota bacterium]
MKLYNSILLLVKKSLSHRQFLILSSILVGLTAGIAAVVLKTVVHYIQSFLTNDFHFRYQNYLYLIFPFFGIFLTVTFVTFFLKGRFGKGAGHILLHISKKLSIIEKTTMYSHMVTSALTVGFGGSAGLEAPIVVTGAAIGSNYGRVNTDDYRDRTLLLACGSAAGIAAVFDAPIAGLMFALEVLISEVTITAFIPLIIAAATGALCSKVILQEKILLYFSLRAPFNYMNVPFYIILGLLSGLLSLYYAKVFRKVESIFRPLEKRTYLKALIGGLVLALLVFLFPPLFGEGYSAIKMLANGEVDSLLSNSFLAGFSDNQWYILSIIGLITLVKVFATSFTLGSGGNGGNFAPSLFVGAFLGFFFSRFVNLIYPDKLPEANFTLVGMAGILSGVMYAPLTAIFLIAEITGGYELMIPLMIVSASAYAIAKHFEPFSMDTKELGSKGELITGNRDKTILTLLHLDEIIERDFKVVHSCQKIIELTDVISHSKRNIFPVVDDGGKLLGVIKLETIREMLFELENYKDLFAIELMDKSPAVIEYNEEMNRVMKTFDETGAWNLPVVKEGKYIGFISKSSIFTKYRKELLDSCAEL